VSFIFFFTFDENEHAWYYYIQVRSFYVFYFILFMTEFLLTFVVIDGSYNPIFYKWTLYTYLNKKKGSLSVVSLTKQIFSVDCIYAIENVTKVLDLDIGRWISPGSKLDKVKHTYDSGCYKYI